MIKKPFFSALFICLFFSFEFNAFALQFNADNDTLNKPYFDSLSYTIYPSLGGGFVSGNNAYADKAKVQEFRVGNPCNIYGVLIHFGYKNFVSLNDSSYVGINFYQLNGTGINTVTNSAACPGNIFYKDSIKVADIDTINGNVLSYSNPLFTDSNFAIGIDFNALNNTDTVALFTNKDGDAGSREQSWEQLISGNWVTLKYSWPLHVDYAIFPIVNTSVGLNAISKNEEAIVTWPNPSENGEIYLNIPFSSINNLQVYNSSLQLVDAAFIEQGASFSMIKIEHQVNGVYFIKVLTKDAIVVKKVIVR